MYRNYIFDLYGTLADVRTDESKETLWKRLARYYSMQGAAYTARELKHAYAAAVAERERETARAGGLLAGEAEIRLDGVFGELYGRKGLAADGALIRDTGILFRALSLERLRLYAGAAPLLDGLRERGRRLYLLSNAQRLFTEPEMRMLGIYEKFDGVLYSSDAGVKKPSPRFFDALFARYPLRPAESVMVGNDCGADIMGAFRYGLDSVYIHTAQSGERLPLPENCREIRSLPELLRTL